MRTGLLRERVRERAHLDRDELHRRAADEDGDEGVFNGATPFNPEEVDQVNFTAYEDLTETQVLGWIQSIVVGAYKEHVDGQIAKQIAAKKTPVEEVNEGAFPWSPPVEEPEQPVA